MMGGDGKGVLKTFVEHSSWVMSLQLRLKDSKSPPEEEESYISRDSANEAYLRNRKKLVLLKYTVQKDSEKQDWRVMKAIYSKIDSSNFILKYVEIDLRVYLAIARSQI